MQRHLDAPCSKCHATVELLRKIEATAQSDAQLNVPESAVRIARAIFALNKPEEVHLKPGILARLVFDSFREPAMAGVRSGRQLARQTLYEAGDYTIDLRFEPDLDPAQVVRVGQIATGWFQNSPRTPSDRLARRTAGTRPRRHQSVWRV